METFRQYHRCLGSTQQGLWWSRVPTWRPPRAWLSTWTKWKLISAHVYLLLSPSSHSERHMCLPVLASLLSSSHSPREQPSGLTQWVCCCLLRGRLCHSFFNDFSYEIRGICRTSRLVNAVPFQSWKKAWLSPPSGPCALVTHSLFLGSHTISLTKIKFTMNQANTSLF